MMATSPKSKKTKSSKSAKRVTANKGTSFPTETAPKRNLKTNNDPEPAKQLASTVKSKDMRVHISDAINDVLQLGRSFEITNRGRTVAILAPRGNLPKGLRINETVTTTHLARGKRNFGSVAAHGPYMVRRGDDNVAVLYAPGTNLGQRIDLLMSQLDELEVIDAGIEKRKRIRQTADEMIRQRIALLRTAGDDAAARKIEEAFKAL